MSVPSNFSAPISDDQRNHRGHCRRHNRMSYAAFKWYLKQVRRRLGKIYGAHSVWNDRPPRDSIGQGILSGSAIFYRQVVRLLAHAQLLIRRARPFCDNCLNKCTSHGRLLALHKSDPETLLRFTTLVLGFIAEKQLGIRFCHLISILVSRAWTSQPRGSKSFDSWKQHFFRNTLYRVDKFGFHLWWTL